MRVSMRRASLLLIVWALLVASAFPQSNPVAGVERTYPFPLDQVRQNLQHLGGFAGGRLPLLDGFVPADTTLLERYERPYYQFKIELNPVDGNHTTVAVEAKISAWYSEADGSHAGYRSLPSNGHLENDLLDRLQDALSPKPAGAPESTQVSSPAAVQPEASSATGANPLQRRLDDLLAEKQSVEQRTGSLKNELSELEQLAQHTPSATGFASVKHTGTGVMSQMNYGGPVLFRARAEDEFEVLEKQGEWVRVRLGPGSTGWIASQELILPGVVPAASSPGPADQSQLGFWVSREQVNDFAGDWPRLKGKKVLFVFAQSRGSLPDIAKDDRKLVYAKEIFAARYRSAALTQDPFDGVVVIFLGGKGGVAAATMKDIKQWVQGGLDDNAFVSRCSLDPPGEFLGLH